MTQRNKKIVAGEGTQWCQLKDPENRPQLRLFKSQGHCIDEEREALSGWSYELPSNSEVCILQGSDPNCLSALHRPDNQ